MKKKIDNSFYLQTMADKIHSVESYRFASVGAKAHFGPKRVSFSHYDHLTAVVMKSGEVFYGETKCSLLDPYSRRLGYHLSLRRALESAWYKGTGHRPSLMARDTIPNLLPKGKELSHMVLQMVRPI